MSATRSWAWEKELRMAGNVIEMKPGKPGSRAILTLKNALTYQNCGELESKLHECMEQHKTEIILDFKALTFIDSEGLELLVRIHETLRNRGGLLKLTSVRGICRDILMVTRLANIFHFHEDIHQAIKRGA
jgi:anti-sigma B factor antagonist